MLLVTSRLPLRLRGEAVLTLSPPALQDAVLLFRERARSVRPDSGYDGPEVATICERLDRLPLAIELAAVHVGTLLVVELAAQLGELARQRGDAARAESLLTEGLSEALRSQQTWDVAIITTLLRHLANQQQRYASARERYHESLRAFRSFGNPPFVAWCLEGLVAALAATGGSSSAVRLASVAAALRLGAGTPLPEPERLELVLVAARA